jgi:hypothetical protein
MALKTLGTNATTSLSALLFHPSADVMTDSDLAAFNALIKPAGGTPYSADSETGNSGYMTGKYLERGGVMWLPGRGFIRLRPGDWVAVDATTGWPFLLSAGAVASGPYTHN